MSGGIPQGRTRRTSEWRLLQACFGHEIIDGPSFQAAAVNGLALTAALQRWFFDDISFRVSDRDCSSFPHLQRLPNDLMLTTRLIFIS